MIAPRRNFLKKALKSAMSFYTIGMLSGFTLKKIEMLPKNKNKKMTIEEIEYDGDLDISLAENLLEGNTQFELIDTINWPDYPYKPEVKFKVAHCQGKVLLKFFVKEESVLAKVSTINGSVHKDSCVEFFITTQEGGPYYNFEFNCIGVPHAAVGYTRKDRQLVDPEILKSIQTRSSLGNEPFTEKTGGQEWELMVIIPPECFVKEKNMELKGLKARANFYKCADDTVKPHFVTWNPVGTEKPDYHQPRYFGEVRFE